jgi:hypothetical protein
MAFFSCVQPFILSFRGGVISFTIYLGAYDYYSFFHHNGIMEGFFFYLAQLPAVGAGTCRNVPSLLFLSPFALKAVANNGLYFSN